jgi:hypothetical protein
MNIYLLLLLKDLHLMSIKKNKHKLYSYIKVVEYMLNQISKNRCNEMMKEIHDLFEEHKDYPVINEIIVNNIIGN